MRDITLDDRISGLYCLWCDNSENLKLVCDEFYLCPNHYKMHIDMVRKMSNHSKIIRKARKKYFDNIKKD